MCNEERMPDGPMPFNQWWDQNKPADGMLWKESARDQLFFFRTLAECVKDKNPLVISTHYSKSIKLPVLRLCTTSGVTLTIRGNFYDYKISVAAPHDLPPLIAKTFTPNVEHNACYCEGFPKNLVYGSYDANPKQFTASIYADFDLYVMLWLIANQEKEN